MRRIRFIVLGSLFVLAVSSLGWSQANQKSHRVTKQVPRIAVLALSGGNITLALEAPAG